MFIWAALQLSAEHPHPGVSQEAQLKIQITDTPVRLVQGVSLASISLSRANLHADISWDQFHTSSDDYFLLWGEKESFLLSLNSEPRNFLFLKK